jgi:predicted ribosome quality control (RQC) complex YloA/Tae2 family protein
VAAQNDVWLHAHGYPGAHVILRREGRKEEPSGQTLEEAAGVAAYWSKGKTARHVPVVYTLAKYVSRPRGGRPGQAVMKREKTVMACPALLPLEDEVA